MDTELIRLADRPVCIQIESIEETPNDKNHLERCSETLGLLTKKFF